MRQQTDYKTIIEYLKVFLVLLASFSNSCLIFFTHLILKMSFNAVLQPIMQSEEAAEAHFRQHLCIRRAPPGEVTFLFKILIIVWVLSIYQESIGNIISLIQIGLFPACPNCGRNMTYVKVSTRNTARAWRCPRHKGRLCNYLIQVLKFCCINYTDCPSLGSQGLPKSWFVFWRLQSSLHKAGRADMVLVAGDVKQDDSRSHWSVLQAHNWMVQGKKSYIIIVQISFKSLFTQFSEDGV